MADHTYIFHRPDLAISYCEGLKGSGLSNFRSGLFLAGPRRIGKSTFIQADLVPCIQRRKWIPLLIDFWANTKSDPDILVRKAIMAEIGKNGGIFHKISEKTGLSLKKINVKKKILEAELEPREDALPEGTIHDLLQELYNRTRKNIVLILDEAQYLLGQETGDDLLRALKAARDAMNLGAENPRLMFVFTGSDRDKLSELIQKKTQAFYGAPLETFPALGVEFIQAYVDRINAEQKHHKFDVPAVRKAFSILKSRPESLFNAVGRVLSRGTGTDINRILVEAAETEKKVAIDAMEKEVEGLNDLQKSILLVCLEKETQGKKYNPFAKDTMEEYGKHFGSRPKVPRVQQSLDRLRKQGLLWKTRYGTYAIEDDILMDWYASKFGKN